eukprot:gene6200-12566_t
MKMLRHEKIGKNENLMSYNLNYGATAAEVDSQPLHVHRHQTQPKPCIPAEGYTSLVIGQDLYSITNYTADIGTEPFGFMSYTALKSSTGSLTGLKDPINYGSGIEWVQGLVDKYPHAALQIGLYLVDVCDDVLSGELDDKIEALGNYLGSLPTTIYLRIGYEFDSYENHYPTDKYIEVFRKIVTHFKLKQINNIAYVWHATGFTPRDNLPIDSWYPGDEYVDWCGISLFQQPYECEQEFQCVFLHADHVIKFCKKHSKPMMIAESTPFGGIIDIPSRVPEPVHTSPPKNGAGYEGDSWYRWFANVIDYIEYHDIRMWSYINCNWDAQPMWQKNHAKGVRWGDTRIEAYHNIRQKWILEVLQSNRYNWMNNDKIRDAVCSNQGYNASFSSLPVFFVLAGCLTVVCLILITIRAKRQQGYTIIN